MGIREVLDNRMMERADSRDPRVRWSRLNGPAPTAMLELLICLGVMGAMIGVVLQGMHRIQQRLYVLEAISLMSGAKIEMMEYRAATGIWPTSDERAPFSPPSTEESPMRTTGTIRADGAVDYRFSARAGDIAGKVLTIRAWQGARADLPIAWPCGRARVTPLVPASADRTTLSDDELPSPCRARR